MNNYLIEKYKRSIHKLILLDYDGTLVNYTSTPDKATPSLFLLDLLNKLGHKKDTKLIIVTGRGYQDIDILIGHLQIDIIADHGAMIKENGVWNNHYNKSTLWKKHIFPLIDEIALEYKGTFIEEKQFSLALHYRNADIEDGTLYLKESLKVLKNNLEIFDLKIIEGKKIIEVMPINISKGRATMYMVKKQNYDYVLSIGDDITDEDMFLVLSGNENYHTIKVGTGKTFAKYNIDNVNDVILFLERFL